MSKTRRAKERYLSKCGNWNKSPKGDKSRNSWRLPEPKAPQTHPRSYNDCCQYERYRGKQITNATTALTGVPWASAGASPQSGPARQTRKRLANTTATNGVHR
eukprot:7120443-Pyramimonas_sp.AAC.1